MLQAGCALAVAIALQSAQTGPPAERWPDDRPFTRLAQNLVKDIGDLPSRATLTLLAVGGGATAAARRADADLARRADEAGPVSYTTAGDVLGDAWFQGGGAVATYAIGRIARQPRVTHIGSDLIRAQVLNGLITTGLKVSVDRSAADRRPPRLSVRPHVGDVRVGGRAPRALRLEGGRAGLRDRPASSAGRASATASTG